jgi:hypothetical protein
MRGFGGFRAFYYLQTLLTGDNETGRNPARFHTRGPLATRRKKDRDYNLDKEYEFNNEKRNRKIN